MLDKTDLEKIRKQLETYDQSRDTVIKSSREVIKLSKTVIYAVHRKDMVSAEKSVADMKQKFSELQSSATHEKLRTSGSFKVAVQEFVEAISFFELMKNQSIPSCESLNLDPEYYLMGLIDLTGELVRKAINSAINTEFDTSVQLKDFVSELYDELMLFDFPGGELRKKFDSVKYDLKKLDDLILSLKLNGKLN